LSDASSAKPSFTAPDVGPDGDTLTFKLTVSDNDGATSTDSVDVKVNNVVVNQPPEIGGVNQPPAVSPPPPSEVSPPPPSEVSPPPPSELTPTIPPVLLIITAIGASVGGYAIWKLRHHQGPNRKQVLPQIEVVTRSGIENRHHQGPNKIKILPEIEFITRGGIEK
jgi:hypothetical protein